MFFAVSFYKAIGIAGYQKEIIRHMKRIFSFATRTMHGENAMLFVYHILDLSTVESTRCISTFLQELRKKLRRKLKLTDFG